MDWHSSPPPPPQTVPLLPPSFLPFSVAKSFERTIYNQFYFYLNHHSILSDSQSRLRPFHSTCITTYDVDAKNEWMTNLDNGLLNSVIFLDFSKAFGTVDHDLLLHRLSICSIHCKLVEWFRSYLLCRQQKCFVNRELSSPRYSWCMY